MYLYQVRNDQRPPSAGQGVLVSAVAGHIYTATTLRVTIITRAHNLCKDNRQLIVLAINCNHSASKNNCN